MHGNGNKVAIVTGTSRGVGAAMARRLASEGFKVVVNLARSPGPGEGWAGTTAAQPPEVSAGATAAGRRRDGSVSSAAAEPGGPARGLSLTSMRSIDFALALVGQQHEVDAALSLAEQLVIVAQQRGRLSQPGAFVAVPAERVSPVERIQDLVIASPGSRHTLKALAGEAAMSARSLARLFVKETGMTPHQFVEGARMDAACRLLETGNLALKAIAYDCGFGTADRMRVVFMKRLGVTPAQYRAKARQAEAVATAGVCVTG